ncbi:hypothetical protein EN829_057380, partial [Mesorhizobium sp. M00.F.Ca.ET.186.01.1.1]
MLRKNHLFLLLFICFTVLLAACTPETAGTTPTAPATPQPAGGTENTAAPASVPEELVIGFEADAATMLANTDVNYVTDIQIRNIYDPLIDRDEKGALIPVLATEWKN